jgi:FkbM family methyltransferase
MGNKKKQMKFENELKKVLKSNYFNDFGKENYDEIRFGTYKGSQRYGIKANIINLLRKYFDSRVNAESSVVLSKIEKYIDKLEFLYDNLNSRDKKLLLDIVAYRIMSYKEVKLPTNNKNYWANLESIEKMIFDDETIDTNHGNLKLKKMNLNELGFPIVMFYTPLGALIDFKLEQYAYNNNSKLIQAESGETVLDIGGCWGDTALYFAHKVGISGKVYSFEFIPGNIKLHRLNQSLNKELEKVITLIEQPISNISGQKIYYYDKGPGSKIKLEPFEEQTGFTETLSIDDFVNRYQVDKVDFIKMDIEGAEPMALEGAEETIRKFKPKLAIAIYHSWDDFVNIPKWILDLNLGYEIYLDHFTIHAEETVIFAISNPLS